MSGLTDDQVKRLEDASWRGGRNAWLAEVAELVADARAEARAEVRAEVRARVEALKPTAAPIAFRTFWVVGYRELRAALADPTEETP